MMSLALLHAGARIGWTKFSVHPSPVIGIIAAAGVYEYGKRKAGGSATRFPFYLALVTLSFSLNGPLHDRSDSYLFSAHMLQHLMLAFVVAPLMVIGLRGEIFYFIVLSEAVREKRCGASVAAESDATTARHRGVMLTSLYSSPPRFWRGACERAAISCGRPGWDE